jgi:hypothetical protein
MFVLYLQTQINLLKLLIMAKFFELTEENQALVDDVFQDTGMCNYMNLKMVGVSKAKELIKVSKANPLAEYVGKCPDTIVCAIYEDAFDRLDEETKRLLIIDAFGVVFYDNEKDKISIGAPQIVVTVAGRQRFGDDLINAAEAGVLAIQQVEDERRERKEIEKANKKKDKQ